MVTKVLEELQLTVGRVLAFDTVVSRKAVRSGCYTGLGAASRLVYHR